MYCSECGQQASGKFCSYCGHKLAVPGSGNSVPEVRILDESHLQQQTPELAVGLPDNWDQEVRYETLLAVPSVRETINRHASMARKKLSGEDFLKICDKVMPIGVPMEKIASLIQPFYARLGISTGKQRVGHVRAPAGRVMLRMLCSLARHGQSLRVVKQADDGCSFEAVLPSDICALEGDLLVGVRKLNDMTEVVAATKIPGQLFDLGKSNRALDALFADLQQDAA